MHTRMDTYYRQKIETLWIAQQNMFVDCTFGHLGNVKNVIDTVPQQNIYDVANAIYIIFRDHTDVENLTQEHKHTCSAV